MNNDLIFVSRAASRKNGGSSSMLDLSQVSMHLGYETQIFTPLGKFDFLVYRPSGAGEIFKSLRQLPLNLVDEDFGALPGRIKSVAKLISGTCKSICSRRGAIIIDDLGLSQNALDGLRSRGAYIILNHAGSPRAFINYFGNAPHTPESNRVSRYINLIKRYDRVLFQSQDQADEFREVYSASIEYSVLPPSCCEADIVFAKSRSRTSRGEIFHVAVVGSIQPRKNQIILPNLAKTLIERNVNLKFHVIGAATDKGYAQRLKEEIRCEKLERHFKIYGHREDYLNIMAESDIILQPSLEEGVSRILRESLALSKPVVAFAISGTSSLLVHGENSFLSDINDMSGLADGITKLAKSPFIYEKLSRQAEQTYQEKCSLQRYTNRFEEIINQIVLERK